MKKLTLTILTTISILSCKEKTTTSSILFEKDFTNTHKDWKLNPDTSKSDTLIGYRGMEVPVRLSWLTAKDSTDCHRIAYFKLERLPSEDNIKIYNVRSSNIECAMKWESEDKTRFETLVFSGSYETKKGIKTYKFEGLFGQLLGNGEVKMNPFENPK